MEVHNEEIVATKENDTGKTTRTPDKDKATGSQTVAYVVYFIFGVLDILLAFRLVLRLLGASTGSSFVSAIYNISVVFIVPFEGIFHVATTQGIETTSVFEPATLVAIIVYGILAWGIVKLITIFSGEKEE
jgi:glucan phosphoethanolaminetransferase (alkaline phosphatase superfamily)